MGSRIDLVVDEFKSLSGHPSPGLIIHKGITGQSSDQTHSMSLAYEIKYSLPAILIGKATLIKMGEIFTLVAPPGTGKTQMCELLFCLFLAQLHQIEIDNFNIKLNIPEGKECLLLDTERPLDDCRLSFERIYRRIKADQHPKVLDQEKERFRQADYQCWVDIPTVEERRVALERMLAAGNVGLLIIDGFLDFVKSMNDEAEAAEAVRWLRYLANKHEFAAVVTMHPNKGTETMAGHLGAFLYRWSRAVMLMKSHENDREVKVLTSNFVQGKLSHSNEQPEIYYKWDEELKMMVSVDDAPVRQAPNAFLWSNFEIIFKAYEAEKGQSKMPSGILHERYATQIEKKVSTARTHIAKAVDGDLLLKEGEGKNTLYSIRHSVR